MGLLEDLVQGIKNKAIPSVEEAVRDLLGLDAKEELPESKIEDVVAELKAKTRDSTNEGVVLRSLVIYRAIVDHIKGGGTVKFVGADGSLRTLKVRLR